MNRNLARVGIGLAWIVSLALAYVVGKQSAGSRKAEVSSVTDGAKAVTIPSQGGGGSAGTTSKENGGAKGSDPAAGVESRDVRALVAEARRQIGSGSGFFLNPSTVMRALGPLMELSPEELKVAIEEISGAVTDPQQKMMFLSVLLGKWAEDDPKEALEYAEKLQEDAGPTATQALFPVIGSWAREDPEAVWKWFLKKRDSDDFSNGIMGSSMYLGMIFSGMAERNVDSALKKLGELGDDQEVMMATNGIAMSVRDDATRKKLLDRTASMDPELRQSVRQGIANQWAMMDPDGAMDWLRELPQEERSALSNSLSYALIWANPEKGAAFLLEGATEEELPNRYSQVVSAWASRNPNTAGEWLNRQPQGPALDRAKSAFSSVAARRDPESAMEWAKTITEPNLRQGGVQLVYQQWVKKDAAAANVSLEQSGLPPEQIESIKKASANRPQASPTGFRVR